MVGDWRGLLRERMNLLSGRVGIIDGLAHRCKTTMCGYCPLRYHRNKVISWKKKKVNVSCGIFRTPRKTAETRATQAGISGPDIDAMNRWSKFDKTKGPTTPFVDERTLHQLLAYDAYNLGILVRPIMEQTSQLRGGHSTSTRNTKV